MLTENHIKEGLSRAYAPSRASGSALWFSRA